MEIYKIKKGIDLNLDGKAEKVLRTIERPQTYAIAPADYHGILPKLRVKEGEHVKAGDTLFVDKATEQIAVVAPVSGTISQIERGERRKLLFVHITPDTVQEYREWTRPDLEKATDKEVLQLLLESGIFAFFRQRPYDVVPNAQEQPKAIFVSAFSKMPLAADFSYVVEGQEREFKAGIAALAKLAEVHVGICPEQINSNIMPLKGVDVNVFSGPNPSGNVGVQINHIAPVNKGEVVWTVAPEFVVFIGRFVLTGRVDLTRTIALAGSEVKEPSYTKMRIGASLETLLANQLSHTDHIRVINGNPLVGQISSTKDYLHAHSSEICVLPEGDDVNEVLGWIAPRLKQHSTSHSYFSWLMPGKSFAPDCRIKGGQRHMIMSAEYERVFPMDIFPSYLIKAIITGDIDRQEALGIYEVAPEDFAVAEYIDSSKLELQRIVREGLDILRKENA